MNNKHGGIREGAGRPKAKSKKVTLSLRVTPEVKNWLEEQETSAGEIINSLILKRMNDQRELF